MLKKPIGTFFLAIPLALLSLAPSAFSQALAISCGNFTNNPQVNVSSSQVCIASGGTEPYQFFVNFGSLPPGWTLQSSGNTAVVGGLSTQYGTFGYGILVTDHVGASAQYSIGLFVQLSVPLNITTRSPLPPARVGTPYSVTFTLIGGVGPFLWAPYQFPPGFTLSPSGVLTANPTDPGTYTLNVTLTDQGIGNALGEPFSLTVLPALLSQSINFPGIPNNSLGSSPLSISATASSGLPVSFRSNNPSVCAVSGNTVTLTGVGVCSITATQDGNASYLAATPVTQTFTVTNPLTPQSIFFGALPSRTLGDPPFPVSASTTSGLPVSFSSSSPSTCTVSGNVVTVLAAGTCSITATQSGSSTYAAALPVTQTFIISPPLAPQTISFTTIGAHTFGDAPFPFAATATSGLAVVVTSNTPSICLVSQTTVTILAAGICTLTATQSGNAAFAAASTSQTFVVAKANQSISFAPIAPHLITDAPFDLQAFSSSGLPVVLTLLSGPASLNGVTLSLAGIAGTVALQATQAGSANFNGASAVTRTFDVTSSLPVITAVTNGASFKPLPLAPTAYAAAFGTNFAAKPGDPPTTITLIDSAASQATATIVYAGDMQLNFLVPPGLATGPATLTVKTAAGTSLPYALTISSISPGLFTQDAAGVLPAARVLTVAADGTRAIQPVGTCGASQNCIYVPISLAPGTSVYLLLYGTGIRGRSTLDSVSATMDGLSIPVLFAGPQGDFPGLDQINLQLPNTLAGSGGVDLQLTVDGVQANVVRLVIN